MRRCWWLTGQVGPPPPPLRDRPHRLTAGRGAAVPAPARTVSGNVSYYRGPVRGEKQQTFYQCTQKCIISIPPRDTKHEFRGHGKVVVSAVEIQIKLLLKRNIFENKTGFNCNRITKTRRRKEHKHLSLD